GGRGADFDEVPVQVAGDQGGVLLDVVEFRTAGGARAFEIDALRMDGHADVPFAARDAGLDVSRTDDEPGPGGNAHGPAEEVERMLVGPVLLFAERAFVEAADLDDGHRVGFVRRQSQQFSNILGHACAGSDERKSDGHHDTKVTGHRGSSVARKRPASSRRGDAGITHEDRVYPAAGPATTSRGAAPTGPRAGPAPRRRGMVDAGRAVVKLCRWLFVRCWW